MLDGSRAAAREWKQVTGDPSMSLATPHTYSQTTKMIVDCGIARGRRGSVG